MKRKFCFWAIVFFLATLSGYSKSYSLYSPDKILRIVIQVDRQVSISLFHGQTRVMNPSPIKTVIEDKSGPGEQPRIRSSRKRRIRRLVIPEVPSKSREILDHFQELTIDFMGDYSLQVRAYNDGIAYRWTTRYPGEIQVTGEEARFTFNEQDTVYFPEEKSFFSHNERDYIHLALKDISAERFCSLPALICTQNHVHVLITESDLVDYPGMWLRGSASNGLSAVFPGYPLEERLTRDRDLKVTKTAPFIARTSGTRQFPWRILAVAPDAGSLITNQLTYLLAEPNQIADTSWIKPGKVAWDWWNFNNIYGVPFLAGINTETYTFYIDFAAGHGIEYIILDEGWYRLGNLLDVNPDINIEKIVRHGKEKGVGIILWVVWYTLEKQLHQALDQFQQWGVSGIKVDFMQRDDQKMVNYYHMIAAEAAKRKMIVDFHGAYKPCGLRRSYPNVLTREGVKGLEHAKWTKGPTPEHNVTLPFIRMVAGPMDYTPGAMINAQAENFCISFRRPMSMGTRCHQLAMYVVYESPLQMLCDSPSNYLRESECTRFIVRIPTVWDRTLPLKAKIGDYIILARKHGNRWYLGAMNDGTAREFSIPLDFLDTVRYTIESFRDGPNAHRFGNDYQRISGLISSSDILHIKMAPGGGFAAILSPEE